MTDFANLGIQIDTSPVSKAAGELDKLSQAAEKTARSKELLARQNAQMSQALKISEKSSQDLAYAQQKLTQLELEAAAAADKFMFKLAQEAQQAGKTKFEILEMQAAMHGVSDGAAPLIEQMKKAEEGMHKMNFATVGARRELLVLAHEASQGQWQRFGGSLMVLGERVDAMSMLFSASGVAVLGSAAALGIFAYRATVAVQEQEKINNALRLTGNYAGQTTGTINALSKSLSDDLHVGTGKARETLTQLAATGQFTGGELEQAGRLALKMSKMTDEAAEDIVKDMAKMTHGVTKYAEEADSKYHFLNVAQLEHIKKLEELGQKHQAMSELMRAWDSKIPQHVENIGLIKMAYMGWAEVLGVIDEKIGKFGQRVVGKPEKVDVVAAEQEELNKLLEKRRNLQRNPFGAIGADDLEIRIADQRKKLRDAIEAMNKDLIDAGNKQRDQLIQEDGKAAQARIDAYVKNNKTALEKWKEESAKIRKDMETANAAFAAVGQAPRFSEKDIEAAIAEAKPKDTAGIKYARSDMNAELSEIEGQITLQESIYKNAKRVRDSAFAAKMVDYEEQFQQEVAAINKQYQTIYDLMEREKALLKSRRSVADPAGQRDIDKKIGDLNVREQTLNLDSYANVEQAYAKYKSVADAKERLAKATEEYTSALQGQLSLEREAMDNQVAGLGRGNTENQLEQRLYRIQKEGEREMARLRREKANAGDDDKANAIERELEAQRQYIERRIELEREGAQRMKEAQLDWTNGAKSALANYRDYAENVSAQVSNMVSSGFRNMEDAVVNFAMTGKLNFHNFAEGVISDLIRIYIRQQMVGMFNYFGFGSGGKGSGAGTTFDPNMSTMAAANGAAFAGSGVRAFASGGVFTNSVASQPTLAPMALFGEAGPEAIMPLKRGPDGSLGVKALTPATKNAAGGGVNITIQTTIQTGSDGSVKGAQTSASANNADAGRLAETINGVVKQSIANEMRPGGLIWKMKQGQI